MIILVDYQQFKPGQMVKNQFGQILTVLLQQGCQVFVEEECLGHYHPNRLFPVTNSTNIVTQP